MLNLDEAKQLIEKFIELRTKAHNSDSPSDIISFERHEKLCIEKFRYLVTMKTDRYKSFSNYEDLNQEGTEALIKAMKTFKPHKSKNAKDVGLLFFCWAHRYIGTRISRSANLHTTIRYPLKVAKALPPHKELTMPLQIEEHFCPDKEVEESQTTKAVREVLSVLTPERREIIRLAYGFDGDKPMSVNKICKRLGISRLTCIKTINAALSLMKEGIKI